MVNHTIMSVDLNKMDSMAKEFYLIEKQRILQETRNTFENNTDRFDYISNEPHVEILSEMAVNEDVYDTLSESVLSADDIVADMNDTHPSPTTFTDFEDDEMTANFSS